MNVFTSGELLLRNPAALRGILIDALKGGYLSLFVGAGVSMSTATERKLFPSWPALVKKCCESTDTSFDDAKWNDNRYLRRAAEGVEEACKAKGLSFAGVVEDALYSECPRYEKSQMKLDLLVALGSLVMSSLRGSAAAVVNYNFDDLLEWYLELHGFRVGIVTKVPDLLVRSDVVIYHPHGFLPKTNRFKALRTTDLIFGERSYQRAIKDNVWNEVQRARFGFNVCLFIGLSGDDPHIEQLFSEVHDELKNSRLIGVLVCEDKPENRAVEDHNRRRGLMNYYIGSHDDLPEFLLSLCRKAADIEDEEA